MTDETRAELRRQLDEMVRWAMLPGAKINTAFEAQQQSGNYITGTVVYMPSDVEDEPPPLTTAQQLALSVLLGDEAVLPEALADYLLDTGHEYAVECFRKGVESANPFAAAVKAMTPALSTYAEAMAEIGRRVAESISSPPNVLNDSQTA